MLKDAVAVIDIGSYSLTAVIGENGINNNFTIRAIKKCEHDALFGEIDEKKLYEAVEESIKTVSASAKARLDEVYIGVPGQYLRLINKEQRAFYNRKRRIGEKELKDLYDGACSNINTGDYEIISRSSVCFYVDGGLRVDDVLGVRTASIASYVSIFLARKDFLFTMRRFMEQLKIRKVHFIPVPLAEGNLLFSTEERRSIQILYDVGYLSSTFTILTGDGALYTKTFPVGGGNLTAKLFQEFEVDFYVAERLKRKINLSVRNVDGDYSILSGEETYNFSVSMTNEIACNVINEIAENFDRSLAESCVKLPANLSASLTGGGISYIRGGADYLSHMIEIPINIVAPKIAYMSKPDDSSCLAVLNYALNVKTY